MAEKNSIVTTPDGRRIDVDQNMALIEKGQQLAGHYPSDEALNRARRVLTGELTPEAARAELNAALDKIAEEERGISEDHL